MKFTSLFLLIAFFTSCSQEEAGIRPRLSTITEAVYGTATVVPKEAYTVFSSVSGIVERSMLSQTALGHRSAEGHTVAASPPLTPNLSLA